MSDHQELRRSLSMTQGQMAALMGVTQAAVSQYEASRRIPTGDESAFYQRLRRARTIPVVTETVRHRETTMPKQRWERVVDPDRATRVFLPVRLHWSPVVAHGWDLGDDDDRRDLYTQLIDVGTALDIMVFVDPDELVRWSDDLLIARAARPVLNRLLDRVAVPIGG